MTTSTIGLIAAAASITNTGAGATAFAWPVAISQAFTLHLEQHPNGRPQ